MVGVSDVLPKFRFLMMEASLVPGTPIVHLFPRANPYGPGQLLDFQLLDLAAEKRTRPPPKENHLGNFSGLKENFPGRWWIQKPYKNQENHIHHRNLSSVDPIFFCNEKFCTGAGRCMPLFLFPSARSSS